MESPAMKPILTTIGLLGLSVLLLFASEWIRFNVDKGVWWRYGTAFTLHMGSIISFGWAVAYGLGRFTYSKRRNPSPGTTSPSPSPAPSSNTPTTSPTSTQANP